MAEWSNPGGEQHPVDPNAAPPQPYGYPAQQPAQHYPAQQYQQYPQQQYPGAPAPYPAQPYGGYPQQSAYPGYPPAPNPWAYQQPYQPGYPQPNKRPGMAIASAVLGYVNAGILVLAGALLLFGASVVNGIENSVDSSTDYGTEIAIDGFINFIAAGLLIAGAIMLTGRNPVGRILYTVGGVIVLGEAVYWLVRFNDLSASSVVVWSVLFIALSVIGMALMWAPDVNRWMTSSA